MMFKEFRETEDFKSADVITFVGTDGEELDIDNPYSDDLNGFYVEKLGYGEYHETMNASKVKKFLTRLPKYQEKLEKVKNHNNDGIVRELKYRIEKYSKD